jgi:hypothetical protein
MIAIANDAYGQMCDSVGMCQCDLALVQLSRFSRISVVREVPLYPSENRHHTSLFRKQVASARVSHWTQSLHRWRKVVPHCAPEWVVMFSTWEATETSLPRPSGQLPKQTCRDGKAMLEHRVIGSGILGCPDRYGGLSFVRSIKASCSTQLQ